MTQSTKRFLFFLFLISGFCGLLYQIVWMRMAFASFGVITPVLSVVLSVFMLGLFAGSWLAGKYGKSISRAWGLSPIYLYAAAELVIGIGGLLVPKLFIFGADWLLPAGESNSASYLAWSSLVIAGSIFPWCVAMGSTFPLMMAFAEAQDASDPNSFSFLYLANVIGAMLGTATTAVVLVEVFGFQNTLRIAASLNALVAILAMGAGRRFSKTLRPTRLSTTPSQPLLSSISEVDSSRVAVAILFFTGFASMAMEVVWTRAFAVVLKTQVYSFAGLLFVYLLATWCGSFLYRRHIATRAILPTAKLIAYLTLAALLPIALNDPRLGVKWIGALVSIFPFCALLGYLTPKLIDHYSNGKSEAGGYAYAMNILGCILGPLFASYFLLPVFGLKYSLLVLAVPFPVFFLIYARSESLHGRFLKVTVGLTVALMLTTVLMNRTYEDQGAGYQGGGLVRRDHTATVISYGTGRDKQLLVNGLGITIMTPITKLMAHLPLLSHVEKPESALVICFGMGTTFRSLMSWKILTTAVELVPKVKEAFPFYFEDAETLLRDPRGKIVIDDGRRFLKRTPEKFDVITLDPPPPVEAAGSSLLYSREFFSLIRDRLRPGGILAHWYPNPPDRTAHAALRALTSVFPHVRMFRSFEGWGYHFLASSTPISIPNAAEIQIRMPETAKQDLLEWNPGEQPATFLRRTYDNEIDIPSFLRGGDADIAITDDRPYNEYYLLRRTIGKDPDRG